MITIKLNIEEARILREVIVNGTKAGVIPTKDVNLLDTIKDSITHQLNLEPKILAARISATVEDYMDSCNYSKTTSLTGEDIDYLASELQISTQELESHVSTL